MISTLTISSHSTMTNTPLTSPISGNSNPFSTFSLLDNTDIIEIDNSSKSMKSAPLNVEKDRERDRERARPRARKGLMGFKGFQAAMGKSFQLSNKISGPKSDITAVIK